MANVKISALPSTSTTTLDDWFVKNNSGETTTNKVKVRDTIGLTKGTANDSIKSASFLSSTPATSQGQGSVAIGNDAEANADYSTAVGNRAECFDNVRVNSTALGAFTRVAQYSTAVGENCVAVGANSTAMGSNSGAYGGQDIAIGKNAQSTAQRGIAIGINSQVSAVDGIAIGYGCSASAADAVAFGLGSNADMVNSVAFNGRNTIFSGTTAVKGLDTEGNVTDRVVTNSGSASYTINMNVTSSNKIVITASTSINITNMRFGGRYRIMFENTGTFNLSSVTGTDEGGNPMTFKYNSGSRNNLTHNQDDIWYIDVMESNTAYVTQFANYQ